MKKTVLKTLLSFILCTVLIAAAALMAGGCGDSSAAGGDDVSTAVPSEVTTIGKGSAEFLFNVEGPGGEHYAYHVFTDEKTVGDALADLGLIEGEEGEFGLYVKTVNGITLDYDTDGMYWAFYEDDKYAVKGIDLTTIQSMQTYSLRAEKG